MPLRIRLVQVLALGAAAVFWFGCEQNVDLSAVRNTAATALSAKPAFDAIADDYAATCRRRAAYDDALHLAASACDDEAQITKGWHAVDDGWFAYFEALGALAGSSAASDYGFGTLAKDITANKTLAAAVPSAVTDGSALQDLAAAVFAARRRAAIAQTVPQAVAYLTACARAQTDLASIYRLSLENERFELNKLARERSRTFLSERYAIEKDRIHDNATISDREAAADAYAVAVAKTLASQTALLGMIRSGHAADLAGIATAYDATFGSTVAPLEKAFK